MSKTIMGVQLKQRMANATKFRSVLSKYSCNIKYENRIAYGFSRCLQPERLIILEFIDNADDEIEKFEKEVSALDVVVKKMQFS